MAWETGPRFADRLRMRGFERGSNGIYNDKRFES
jgi:hypothetical protein